jgi:DNA polymerase elongation subunit (family B)
LQKPNTSVEDYVELCQEIESVTGYQISFEGQYKWIAFLSSRMYDDVPVMNRYFGAFEDGEVKVRGIESRRRDTPKIVSKCQDEMLAILGEASNAEDVLVRIPRALDVLKRYRDRLRSQHVPLENLIITRGLSKNPDEYKVDIVQALAAQQLVEEGLRLSAGQKIRYVLTDYKGGGFRRRAVAAQLAGSSTKYDVEKYLDLLVRGAASILTPFGFDEEKIGNSIRNDDTQSNLEELLSPTP